jgi:hypothetical protein
MSAEHMHAAGLTDFKGEHEELVAGPYARTDFGEPSAGGHEGGT